MADGLVANRAFLDYTVVAKTRESDVIASLVLAPADGNDVPAYRPGQHLVFRLTINGKQVLRHYSVSGDPDDTGRMRIAVKREPAPRHDPGLPPGLGSCHMHDDVQVGDVLSAAGPMGEFVLDEDSLRPVLLLSGGVGLTPMMCMLHRLVRTSQRQVYFIHACENGAVHAFGDEVRALAAQRTGVLHHFCYREPTAQDLAKQFFHSRGLVTRDQLQTLLPLDDYDVYLCGPTAFMQANWQLLRDLGIAEHRIHYEFFGPAAVLQAHPDPVDPPGSVQVQPAAGRIGVDAGNTVRFMPSGKTVQWDNECYSLLDLAEQAGLSPDYNCRAGLCNTCMSSLLEGEVDYFEEPLDPPPEGRILLCCSRPLGPVVVKLGRQN